LPRHHLQRLGYVLAEFSQLAAATTAFDGIDPADLYDAAADQVIYLADCASLEDPTDAAARLAKLRDELDGPGALCTTAVPEVFKTATVETA
jgi:hypothetical protein